MSPHEHQVPDNAWFHLLAIICIDFLLENYLYYSTVQLGYLMSDLVMRNLEFPESNVVHDI